MRVAYQNEDGLTAFLDLTAKPVVIGRSPEADLVLRDEKASRLHCGIRRIDNEFLIKDLGSRNGTYVNARRIESAVALKAGDHIRIGTTILVVQEKLAKGAQTILHEIESEMGHGKGYRTILREIITPEDPGGKEKD